MGYTGMQRRPPGVNSIPAPLSRTYVQQVHAALADDADAAELALDLAARLDSALRKVEAVLDNTGMM